MFKEVQNKGIWEKYPERKHNLHEIELDMKLLINADDYGLSQGITNSILQAFDQGVLNGTSIIANGRAFDYAIEQYKKRQGLRLAIHLNLVEGEPVSPAEEIPLLVKSNRELGYSFQNLWWRYWRSSPEEKIQFQQQVRQEWSAQIQRVVSCFDETFAIHIDSHLHYHMLPFAFEVLMELNDTFHFAHIRLPDEPLFFIENDKQALKNYFSLSPIKNLLLAELSRNHRKQLQDKQIATNDHFIGVLFSGKMNEGVVRNAFSELKLGVDDVCEILFHPGKARWDEVGLRSAHYSPKRDDELNTLLSPSFHDWVQSIQQKSGQ